MFAIRRVLSAVRSSPENAAPSVAGVPLAMAALLASAALAGCGGAAHSNCPPPSGTLLGSAESAECGCFAEASVSASRVELLAAIDQKLRATSPADCTYVPSGPTVSLRSGVRIEADALTSMRPTDPREGPDGQPIAHRPYFFALEP